MSASRTWSCLRLELALVGEVLEAAAAADAEVAARRLDAIGAGLEERRADRLREAALHLRRARADEVAGQPAAHEDDEARRRARRRFRRRRASRSGPRAPLPCVPASAIRRGYAIAIGSRLDRPRSTSSTWRRIVASTAAVRRSTLTCTERSRGPSNSQKKIPCHVPSASVPSSRSGTSTLGPMNDARMCVGAFSSPSSMCCQPQSSGTIALERHLEVARDHRIGVLVDRDAGGRVRHVDEHRRSGLAGDGVLDEPRDVDELALPLGPDGQRPHGSERAARGGRRAGLERVLAAGLAGEEVLDVHDVVLRARDDVEQAPTSTRPPRAAPAGTSA